ncbi:MAG: nuclear transport factor 2 family protein [Actinomycetota bacterium]
MNEHPNATTIKKGYEAFLNGDIDLIRQLMADDIVWHGLGDNILRGVFRGKSEVVSFFGKLIMETQGTLNLEVHDVIANDERAVILTTVTAERNGKRVSARTANVYELNSAGKVIAAYGPYSDESDKLDDFWQ